MNVTRTPDLDHPLHRATGHTPRSLREFERVVAAEFNASQIRAPVHLAAGNEVLLIDYFNAHFDPTGDWVASQWRSHYHALLAGIPPDAVLGSIRVGRSITLTFPSHRLITSAIVGGILPIALGIALGIRRRYDASVLAIPPDQRPRIARVHAFVGDMTAMTGAYHEVREYAYGHNLPLNLIVEDNGRSVGTPTLAAWGDPDAIPETDYAAVGPREYRHVHESSWPHAGAGAWVRF